MAIGLISFGIAHNRALEVNDSLTAELNNSQVLLSTTENELKLTQENLLVETEKSSKLNASLKATQAELEDKIAELEIVNTNIEDLKSNEYNLVYIGDFKLTHYCCEKYKHICGTGSGKTATGTKVTAGRTIAVDPKVIPYGTKVYIEGYGWRTAEDCGGAVKNKQIDIAVDTHNEAWSMGEKSGGVWILVKN
jgi:3D (Asp-Asp-Asp) domain-containing protein